MLAALILTERLAAPALAGIGAHQLPAGRLVTAVLFQHTSGPSRCLVIPFFGQRVHGQGIAHREVDLSQLLAVDERPVSVEILRQEGAGVETAGCLEMWNGFVPPGVLSGS